MAVFELVNKFETSQIFLLLDPHDIYFAQLPVDLYSSNSLLHAEDK